MKITPKVTYPQEYLARGMVNGVNELSNTFAKATPSLKSIAKVPIYAVKAPLIAVRFGLGNIFGGVFTTAGYAIFSGFKIAKYGSKLLGNKKLIEKFDAYSSKESRKNLNKAIEAVYDFSGIPKSGKFVTGRTDVISENIGKLSKKLRNIITKN